MQICLAKLIRINMNQIHNPFDHEENLSLWFNQDKFYSSSKLQQLKQFKTHLKQSPNHQNYSIMSFQDSYKNFINTITKHSITATLIMLLALSTVSVAAAQLFAPEDLKPSNLTGLTKKPEPKPVEDKQLSMDKEGEIKTEVEKKSEIDTGKNWTGQITLRPKNYAQFTKFVNNEPQVLSDTKSGVCGVYDLTAYTGKDFNPSMTIVNYNSDASKSSLENPSQKERFDMVSKYINGFDKNDYSSSRSEYIAPPWLYTFNAACGGYASYFLYNLDNSKINFKNVEMFTAIVNLEGQSIPGEPVVLILAKKGDNLIQLRQGLGSNIGGCIDNNVGELNNSKLDGYTKCITSTEFKALAQKAAEELVNTFELDQNSQATPGNTHIAEDTIKKLLSYTNPYFPDFKLVYPEDWKFETTTEPAFQNLLTRKVKLTKNNRTLEFIIRPVLPFGSEPLFIPDAKTCEPGASIEELVKDGTIKIDTFANGESKYTIKTKCKDREEDLNNKVFYGNLGVDSFILKSNIKAKDIKGYTMDPEDGFVRYRFSQITGFGGLDVNDPFIKEIDQIISQSSFK